jgi:hypothetical protein
LALERIIHERPERLILKLLGPGGLAPEAVLSYRDMLDTLCSSTDILTVSYSNLIGADFLLFLLGSSRDIRPSAWCHVFSSPIWAFEHAQNDREALKTAITSDGRGGPFAVDWMHLFWDYETCVEAIGRYVELNEIVDRRLDVADLKELLLIDCWDVDSLLLQQLCRGEKTADGVDKKLPKSKRDRRDGRGRSL